MSNNTHPKTASTLYILSNESVKTLFAIAHCIISEENTEQLSQHYARLRLWMMEFGTPANTDPRTSDVCEQVSNAIFKGLLDIYSNEALHGALCRLVANKNQLAITEPSTSNAEHAIEILGDIDFAQNTLRHVSSQSAAEYQTLQMVKQKLNDLLKVSSNSLQHDLIETISSLVKLCAQNCEELRTRSLQAADEMVTSEDLMAQLNNLDEPLILETEHYQITQKGHHSWVHDKKTGEGQVLDHTEKNQLLASFDALIEDRNAYLK